MGSPTTPWTGSTPTVCTEQEDPDNRYSCAFELKRQGELTKAQEIFAQLTDNELFNEVNKYSILESEFDQKTTINQEMESSPVYGPQLPDNLHLVKTQIQ